MINEKQIRYLMTVAEERNITAAARKLYVSQPALSRMILDLERELGAALFVRDRGDLHPTQAGEIYLRGCQDVLAVSNSVLKQISDLNNSRSGRILLGITSFTGDFLLPLLLDAFEREFPNVELILVEERMSVLKELVKRGKADLAFLYQTDEPDLEYRLVLDNPIYLQVPPGYANRKEGWSPGTQNPPLPPQELNGQPMILLKQGRGMRLAAERLFMEFQIAPGKIIETENIHLARSLVQLNKGFTFVPSIGIRSLSENDSGFYCQIQDYPMKRSLYSCHRKNGYLTEAERFLIDLVPKILSEFPEPSFP